MEFVFKRSRRLISLIDDFFDLVSEGLLVFNTGVKHYLAGNTEMFLSDIKKVSEKEFNADELRRSIESLLYTRSLIPDHRGDVLGLLETTDNIIDNTKKALTQFDVEHPEIPENLHGAFLELSQMGINAGENLVLAARAFFRNLDAVGDHLHKVYHYEKEADEIADQIKRDIFNSNLDLAEKMHLRYFVHHIDKISDTAEDVADRLTIYAMKRRP